MRHSFRTNASPHLHSGANVLRERPRRSVLARLCSYASLQHAVGIEMYDPDGAAPTSDPDAKPPRRVTMPEAVTNLSRSNARIATSLTGVVAICAILAGSVMTDAHGAQVNGKVAVTGAA